jgi:N-acylneuraminate cytidylyltransferase/CMP-N,N'-diacetyllegionaminic acid synthase
LLQIKKIDAIIMYKGKRILAIIPARGGSKGLPGKNIRNLCGKPLIAWSIEHAQNSNYVDQVFVSTDSIEIAKIAEEYGSFVPELRPAEYASDESPSSAFIIYTLQKMANEQNCFDVFVLLEPTSPLRDVEDIDRAIEILIDSESAESIAGVCKVENIHPTFMLTLTTSGLIQPYESHSKSLRRQDLTDIFYFEGSVYASQVDAYLQKKSFYHDKTLPYIVPKWKSFEVDDIVDFEIIETIMKLKIDGFFNI